MNQQAAPVTLSDKPDYFLLAEPQGYITERVYMDISVNGADPQRIIIGMYGKDCPNTVKNFMSIIQGHLTSKYSGQALRYEGSKFHRIIPSFMIQGGDFTRGDGTGKSPIPCVELLLFTC